MIRQTERQQTAPHTALRTLPVHRAPSAITTARTHDQSPKTPPYSRARLSPYAPRAHGSAPPPAPPAERDRERATGRNPSQTTCANPPQILFGSLETPPRPAPLKTACHRGETPTPKPGQPRRPRAFPFIFERAKGGSLAVKLPPP